MKYILLGIICSFLLPLSRSLGQKEVNSLSSEDLDQYTQQVSNMVSFIEYTFNTLGNSETPTKEKDIIINESYTKIFRDEKVQIEDDLDNTRKVVTNKDIQAYLKDIDFFFRQVTFDFDIKDINFLVSEEKKIYFKVYLYRHLHGITIANDTVQDIQERFIEINLNESERDLKIVSIYTTKLSEREDLKNWWNTLPPAWLSFFAPQVRIKDTLYMTHILKEHPKAKIGDTLQIVNDNLVLKSEVLFQDIKNIWNIKTLDISQNNHMNTLAPLSKINSLQNLNISNLPVNDLSHLRNLNKLEILKMNNTKVNDLSPLKYALNLKELYCSQTSLESLNGILHLKKLKKLDISYTLIKVLEDLKDLSFLKEIYFSGTEVSSLETISVLKNLLYLKFSQTPISSLSPINKLTKLISIDLSDTKVTTLENLKNLEDLQVVFCEKTPLSSLKGIEHLKSLKKIYCDNTNINDLEVRRFKSKSPNSLIIYRTTYLSNWWKNLPPEWKTFFIKKKKLSRNPSKEELQKLATVTILNIDRENISNLSPVQAFINLKRFSCNNTKINSLLPLKTLLDLEYIHSAHTSISDLQGIQNLKKIELLDLSYTPLLDITLLQSLESLKQLKLNYTKVNNLSPLKALSNLETLELDHTQINDLSDLISLSGLTQIYCDNTQISDFSVNTFLDRNPNSLVIYKTARLRDNVETMSNEWKKIFARYLKNKSKPSREQLHSMAQIEILQLANNENIKSLAPLKDFLRIKILDISSTGIENIDELKNLKYLKKLILSKTSITSLIPLKTLSRIEYIDCSGTRISDLTPLISSKKMKVVHIQNTSVESLQFLTSLTEIEEIKCSGTQIRSLKPLSNMQNLQILECSNTNISTLKHLEQMKNLKELHCYNTRLKKRKVEAFQKTHKKVKIITDS